MRNTGESKFEDYAPGDVVRVIWQGAQCSLFVVSEVRNHSLHGKDGDAKVKITHVSDNELRFYGETGPNRESVLRCVRLVKVQQVIP